MQSRKNEPTNYQGKPSGCMSLAAAYRDVEALE
jgi:hypothetical protein